jgi:putative ABC transport system permease protein
MALGVMLVVCVLSIHGVIAQSFRNNANLGYNLIVGAKGGALQLTLNSVFYLSSPIENVPYDFYLEFLDAEQRDAEYQNSLQRLIHDVLWTGANAQAVAAHGEGSVGLSACGTAMAFASLEQFSGTHSSFGTLFDSGDRTVATLRAGEGGRYSKFTDIAIPLCLGDYFSRFRSVGTTPEFFEKLKYGEDGDREYAFAEGRNFQRKSEKYGYFEAVVGATVAQEMGLKVGEKLSPTHGDPERGGKAHGLGFFVVGILEPSGTPNDRVVFVNMEGFYLLSGHAKPLQAGEGLMSVGKSAEASDPNTPLVLEQREVTAILVRTSNPIVAAGVENAINEGQTAQAVLPVLEIFRLFDTFVRPIQRVLLVLTVMICVVSGVGILVSIYNSMSERRHEIAVMRALGAGRNTVMTIILLEAVFLSLAGGALGWTVGHGLNVLAGPRIEQQTGVRVGFLDLAPPVNLAEMLGADSSIPWVQKMRVSSELLLIPSLILLAILVGLVPAIAAYRTDVAESLDG